MQAEWNQRTFDNTEDQGSQVSCACDKSSQSVDSVLYDRPYKYIRIPTPTYVMVETIGTNLDPPKNDSAFGS